MRICKYCGAEAINRQVICEPCFQAGVHHPWWIEPVALAVVVVVMLGYLLLR